MFGILTILAIILAIVITAQNSTKGTKDKPEKMTNLSPTQTPTPISTPTPMETPKDNLTIIPPTLTPTLSPTPTNAPSSDGQSVLDFKYPNSIIISQNGNETVYESTNDPKKITDWYKDKIKSMNMNVTTFVQTNTNNNILNKLVGSDGNQEVRVEISKQNNSSIVKIVVVSN